jgi:maltooligosyltrehalose trehalohydrolase
MEYIMQNKKTKIGALFQKSGECRFSVWAPFRNKVEVKILSPEEKLIPMRKDRRGYWTAHTKAASAGSGYFYRLDGSKERPDPASAFQPEGVHRCSQVIDHEAFEWNDRDWEGMPLAEMVMYELHVGTFTPEGTFDAAAERLKDLAGLGINALNIMPVSQFPGSRNWGYDGVHPFAVQNSYGGPEGLKRLINACHGHRFAVILDVVYNHLGPEGNYLAEFGPYFTDRYRTPWGGALNFDGDYSDEVRNFFIQNALHWFSDYHLDALRLDAVHAIYDMSANPFLRELDREVEHFSIQSGRKRYLIAESDLNDVKIITPTEEGGYGLDAQWCDDFHHALHSLLTGEKSGYYVDFGKTRDLSQSIKEGYVLSGQYSRFRKRRYGNSSRKRPSDQFIVFSQNHDQVGNRRDGERLSVLLSFESLKLAAGAVLLSPYIPLLFMGEEYGEESPFLYFTHFSDPDLIRSVREGRREEFCSFEWHSKPPDPQSPQTFLRSKLNWQGRREGKKGTMLEFYHRLIELRKKIPALSRLEKKKLEVVSWEENKVILLHRWHGESHALIVMNFKRSNTRIRIPLPEGRWRRHLASSDPQWLGTERPLPEGLEQDQVLTIPSLSLTVYAKESGS